jgi:imidazolonepropionase-like amidohydrolase
MDQAVGSLTPGKFADLVAFDVAGADPLDELLGNDRPPTGVWIGGARQDGA